MSRNLILGAWLNFVFNEIISHIPWHALRRGFLRLFNKNIHPSVVVLMHVRLLNFWNLQIGERVVINQYCVLDSRRFPISIGSDTDIGPYTRIWTLGHDPDDSIHGVIGGGIVIEDHVWIASNVTLLPGVHLGRGAVVGASSVVHQSVGALEIVVGSPAKFVRKRKNSLNYRLKYKVWWE